MNLKGYTNIQDWMLTLNLDVYETIVFAVIYGFSQDGESTFTGSQNYLAAKAKCSRRKIAMVLPSLVEKGLIIKIDRDVRGIHLCEYKVSTKFTRCESDAQGGCECDAHNTIDNENIDSISIKQNTKSFIKPTLQEVTDYCNERGNNVNPQTFMDHYESNGWMVGKTHMKDWRASVRTWESQSKRSTPAPRKKESVLEHNLKVYDQMFGTDLHSQAYGQKEDCDEQ